jgi:hypothetical protein
MKSGTMDSTGSEKRRSPVDTSGVRRVGCKQIQVAGTQAAVGAGMLGRLAHEGHGLVAHLGQLPALVGCKCEAVRQ